jgi:hypothetical protein
LEVVIFELSNNSVRNVLLHFPHFGTLVVGQTTVLGDAYGRAQILSELKQLLKFAELSLKAHIRENDWSSFAGKCECRLERHVFLLHQVRNYAAGRPRDTGVAVDQDATLSNSLLDKGNCGWKVANERAVRRVSDVDDLIHEILGEAGLDPIGYLQDVRDASVFEAANVLGSLKIA